MFIVCIDIHCKVNKTADTRAIALNLMYDALMAVLTSAGCSGSGVTSGGLTLSLLLLMLLLLLLLSLLSLLLLFCDSSPCSRPRLSKSFVLVRLVNRELIEMMRYLKKNANLESPH